MKYRVMVTAHLSGFYTVEASSLEDALEKTDEHMYGLFDAGSIWGLRDCTIEPEGDRQFNGTAFVAERPDVIEE